MPSTTHLPAFFAGLTSVERDDFVRVMGRLEIMGSRAEIERLEQELEQVKAELDRVNARRDDLRLQKIDLERLLAALDRLDSRETTADLLQMRLTIQTLEMDIDQDIAASRPADLHVVKVRIKRDLQRRRLLSQLAAMIRSAAGGKD